MSNKDNPYTAVIPILYKCWLNGDSMRKASRKTLIPFYSVRVIFNEWEREKNVID